MADFVAVLKKTLDGLGETTPEVRAKVYDKARATIESKLAAINPPPPAAVADRQRRALEDAIASIEKEYARPPAAPAPALDPLAELENIFSSIDRNRNQPTHARPATKTESGWPPSQTEAKPQPAAPARAEERPTQPSWQRPTAETRAPESRPQQNTVPPAPPARQEPSAPGPKPALEPVWPKPKTETKPVFDFGKTSSATPPPAFAPETPRNVGRDDRGSDFAASSGEDETTDETFGEIDEPERKRSFGRIIAAVVALAVLGGGGYGVWLNKDAFKGMFGLNKTETAADKPAPAAPAKPNAPAQPATAANTPAPAPAPESSEPQKFTQRLQADGKETDPGRAGGAATVGEGTSVVALTTPSPTTPPVSTQPQPAQAQQPTPPAATPGANPAAPATTTPAAQGTAAPSTPPAPQAIPVGQKAIYYEERTSAAEGSAQPGNIVWSLVQESPGGDAPPEPAIRAEVTIPGKDVQLRMTIRRNADQTLPASHIIEMIFLTPQGFEGGGIENVLRIAMKTSEQEAGSPLIGVPAKIADGYFLVALNDTKADQDANLTLLRNQEWIDIPVVYKSGRRALLTMEKGLPGEKIFDEAMKAWQAKTSG
ncbi:MULTISPECIES: hypothetical protein [Phyllobacteriaceae]|jgi:hypothetical protein|uniref:Uncharacterized protein n=1 Tax=Mesorhizobium hungaricum TaxID=1566387 RepID=A0A1C2DF63_9HYPH|nr:MULTISPECIES: hypothetical protein [Mesorhizobium]MBN9232482.1 hypothetical protein [Mesorhizobium sp.]MDQ0330079.1 hypothetical protein [Mesorhizobium sp. YL-MeA3-2017]OCX13380.1 hypothetical protein QV13_28205 [Mesorhizobium hungaricum]